MVNIAAPELGTDVDADVILGVGKVGNKVILLLDSDKVLGSNEALRASEKQNVA